MNQSGILQSAPLDEPEETAIKTGDLQGALLLADKLVRRRWGGERGDRLMHHHRTVANLVSRHGWPVARKYDVDVGQKAACDSYDLATLDAVELAIVISEVGHAIHQTPFHWSPGSSEPRCLGLISSRTGTGEWPRSFDGGNGQPTKLQQQASSCARSSSRTALPRWSAPMDLSSVSIGRGESSLSARI